MFIRNLTKIDLIYRANNKVITLKANTITHVDNTVATEKDIRNAFMNHVDVLPSDFMSLIEENIEEENDTEITVNESIETIIEDAKQENNKEIVITIDEIEEDTEIKKEDLKITKKEKQNKKSNKKATKKGSTKKVLKKAKV